MNGRPARRLGGRPGIAPLRAHVGRAATIALVACLTLMALPGSAAATITGPCTAEGHTATSSVDLTTAAEWHLRTNDLVGGSGSASTPVRAASVWAWVLGLRLPIIGGSSNEGGTAGAIESVSVASFAVLGRRFVVSGSTDNGCAGQVEIVIDDQGPLFTILGGGGLLFAVVGLVVLAAMLRGEGRLARRLTSGLVVGLGAAGAALAAEQLGLLDPTEPVGLLIAIAAAVLGFGTCGVLRSRDARALPGRESSGAS